MRRGGEFDSYTIPDLKGMTPAFNVMPQALQSVGVQISDVREVARA